MDATISWLFPIHHSHELHGQGYIIAKYSIFGITYDQWLKRELDTGGRNTVCKQIHSGKQKYWTQLIKSYLVSDELFQLNQVCIPYNAIDYFSLQ